MTVPSLHGVSVVIPTYNRSEVVCEAVKSALEQKWEPLEVIVVDDCSSDDTLERLESLRQEDARLRYITRATNAGPSIARNEGILTSTMRYIAFLDSDDRFHPDKLALQMPILLAESVPTVAFTAYTVADNTSVSDVLLSDWSSAPRDVLERLLVGCCVHPCTVVTARRSLVEVGMFRDDLICCEDHDLWLRLALRRYRFLYVERCLTSCAVRPGSLSTDERAVAQCSEEVVAQALASTALPLEFRIRRSVYEARWALNSTVRYIRAGDGPAALAALWRAAHARPRSIRPGWLVLAFRAAGLAARRFVHRSVRAPGAGAGRDGT